MKKWKVAYFGSPSFSALFLEKILQDKNLPVEIEFTVTQPDRPVGRKLEITPSPVKIIAQKYKIPIVGLTDSVANSLTPSALRKGEGTLFRATWDLPNGRRVPTETRKSGIEPSLMRAVGALSSRHLSCLLTSVDFVLVYAYGQIIPKEFLSLPKYGFINIHPSLLPLYRGASPTAYPLILGDTQTGVTFIQMDAKMDHGPILMRQHMKLDPYIRRPEVEVLLTETAYDMFTRLLSRIPLKGEEQNHEEATYTRMLVKNDGFIPLPTLKKALVNDPLLPSEIPPLVTSYLNKYRSLKLEDRRSSQMVYDLFRGLYPWPGLWTSLQQPPELTKRLKIIDLSYQREKLVIRKVQLEGKKEVDFETFNKAYHLI